MVSSGRKGAIPNFLFNSLANLIAILFKKQLSLGETRSEHFKLLIKRFFMDLELQNMYLIKMGLKIFEYIVENVLIDSEKVGYFNYRKLINTFQQSMLFKMVEVTRYTCKFFIACNMNLEGLLLVRNDHPQINRNLTGEMIKEDVEIVDSTNVLYLNRSQRSSDFL